MDLHMAQQRDGADRQILNGNTARRDVKEKESNQTNQTLIRECVKIERRGTEEELLLSSTNKWLIRKAKTRLVEYFNSQTRPENKDNRKRGATQGGSGDQGMKTHDGDENGGNQVNVRVCGDRGRGREDPIELDRATENLEQRNMKYIRVKGRSDNYSNNKTESQGSESKPSNGAGRD